MDFSAEFFWHSLRAAAFALFFFSLPGFWLALLLGWRANLSALLIAPALGLCGYGAVSLLITWLIGYSGLTLGLAWLLFQGLAVWWYVNQSRQSQPPPQAVLALPGTAWLLLAVAMWALVPAANIYPALYEGGLYVNGHIYDHMKIAFIDAIAREGMPPVNPFYAPGGERIELTYYYAWHFLGAQIKTLSGVSGWQAEVALAWLTGFSVMGLLVALAARISGRLWAGFAVLLLGLVGAPADILPYILGARWERWFGFPPGHWLEVLWIQLSWAPQHVFSALSSVLLLFLVSRALLVPHLRWQYAVSIGLTAAIGFGASIWVGGVALALALPALLWVLWRLRLDYARWWGPLLLAVTVCVVFALPVLSSVATGPSAEGFPLAVKLYNATRLFERDMQIQHLTGHVLLYWLQFLPLCFGVIYILGLFAAAARPHGDPETRIFQTLGLAAIIAYLLIVQWVQSVIVNNDFGWRSALVPVMLLQIWAAVALAELPHSLTQWRGGVWLQRARGVLIPLVWVGITVGLLSAFRLWAFPQPHPRYNPTSPEQLAWHQDFFQQREAWAALRRHTAPGDLAQNNPDTYATVVTPWPAPASAALFGDRSVAYGEPETVNVFAHAYDKTQKASQYTAVQALFAAHPAPGVLAYARDVLKIKALLLDRRDPAWPGQAIEDSGVYRLVESGETFKVFLANDPVTFHAPD